MRMTTSRARNQRGYNKGHVQTYQSAARVSASAARQETHWRMNELEKSPTDHETSNSGFLSLSFRLIG